MPFSVDIDRDKRLVASVWTGEVDEAECVAYIDDVWGDPTVGDYDELLDFRAVTAIDLPLEAMQRLVSRSRAVANPGAASRSVLVASAELVYGLSRMYVAMRDIGAAHEREWNVVDDIDVARRWLRGAPRERFVDRGC